MIDQETPTYTGSLEPLEFTISEEIQGQYLEALQDYHLRYVMGRRETRPIVHPGIILSHSNATRSPSFGGPNTQWIHLREQTRFAAAAHLDDVLVVRWHVAGHESRLGRTLTRVWCRVTRRDGLLILERLMWGFRSSIQRPVAAAAGGDPADPALVPRASTRTALTPDGWVIPGRQKLLTAERMRLFSGWTSRNLHTDDQIAKAAGLPAPVASATQGMGYLCEFMIDNIGEEWLADGSWKLTFRKPMLAGDQINAHGEVSHFEQTDQGSRYTVDIGLTNQRGTMVTHGTATSRLHSA